MTTPTDIARVTIPIEWDYKSEQHYDERTMSYRYTVTATPTKYASVPVEAVRAAIIEEEGKDA